MKKSERGRGGAGEKPSSLPLIDGIRCSMNVQRVHIIINIKPDTVPDLDIHVIHSRKPYKSVSQRGRVTRVRVTVQVKKQLY